jgi:hypothetical protein
MMKTKVATVLSIVGVLGAGSAAALVNTQILDGAASESAASAAVLPEPATVDLTVPTTTIDDIDDERTSSTTVPTVAAPAAAPSAPATTGPPSTTAAPAINAAPAIAPAARSDEYLTAFNVGDSGVVTVDVVSGRLILVNAEAAPGWTVTKAEEDGPDHVEVTFTSSTVRVEFEATFDGTTITPSVSSASIPKPAPASAAPAPSPTPTAQYDDHDSDDHDSDDHDSDDHDSDDHEAEAHESDDHESDDHDSEDHEQEDERRDDD